MNNLELAVRQVRVTDVDVDDVVLNSERRLSDLIGSHRYSLITATDGSATVTVDGAPAARLVDGSAVLVCSAILAERAVAVRPGPGHATLLVAAFDCAGDLFSLVERGLPKLITVADQTSVLLLAALGAARTTKATRASTSAKIIEAVLASTIGSVVDGDPRRSRLDLIDRDSPVGGTLFAVQTRPADPWSVVDMARAARMSPSRFTVVFSETTGTSPMEYVTRWRMALARHLLEEDPAVLVAEVARRVGYATPFGFSNAFKRHYGVSPSQMRIPAGRAIGVGGRC